MGRLVGVAFFFLAFVVFAIVKEAARGAKGAFQAASDRYEDMAMARRVRELEHDERAQKIASSSASLIRLQMELSGIPTPVKKGVMKKHDLTFLFGYCEGVWREMLARTDLPAHRYTAQISSAVLGQIIDQDGDEMASVSSSETLREDRNFVRGFMAGKKDISSFITNPKKSPMSLSYQISPDAS